jgi:hypothetical protein
MSMSSPGNLPNTLFEKRGCPPGPFVLEVAIVYPDALREVPIEFPRSLRVDARVLTQSHPLVSTNPKRQPKARDCSTNWKLSSAPIPSNFNNRLCALLFVPARGSGYECKKPSKWDSAILPCSIRARPSLRCGRTRDSNS